MLKDQDRWEIRALHRNGNSIRNAIIHNSDYASVEAAKAAIDRYFSERNDHFQKHPRRAGKKLWGKERVEPEFNEANNCKDPHW